MRPAFTAALLAVLAGSSILASPHVVLASCASSADGAAGVTTAHGLRDNGTEVALSIAADGTIRVDGTVARGDAAVLASLKAAVAAGKSRVTMSVDKSRPYGEVIHVIDLCKQVGLTKIAFAVSP